MWKIVLIFVSTVASAALAAPNLYNQVPWKQNQNRPGFPVYTNQPQPDWNNYGNDGPNGIVSYPNRPQIDWNNYANQENNVAPYPNQPQVGWNNWNNEGDVNLIANSPAYEEERISDCGPSQAYKDVPGMQNWCRANCFHTPSFCPSSHCRCW